MKILYFCYQYYILNGSRTHARSFYQALSTNELVSSTVLFPVRTTLAEGIKSDSSKYSHTNRIRGVLQYAARMAWRNVVPGWIRLQLGLLYPSPILYRSLSTLIRREHPDAIVLRIGGMFRFIGHLRRDFPRLKICIEFNATGFDEYKAWVPKLDWWRLEEARQLGFADCICAVSNYLQRYLLALNPALDKRVVVNPNGVDTDLFRPLGEEIRARSRNEMDIPHSAVVFGYVGGTESFRRLPEVVRQMADLRRRELNRLFLVIIGRTTDTEAVAEAISKYSGGLPPWMLEPIRLLGRHEFLAQITTRRASRLLKMLNLPVLGDFTL